MIIIQHPDKRLLRKAKTVYGPVNVLVGELKRLIIENNLLGLAAPQVAHNVRVFVYRDGYTLRTVINPTILSRSDVMVSGLESCASIDGYKNMVERAEAITVEYSTEGGLQRLVELTGLTARVFQHEYDHLVGVLINGSTPE